MGLLDNLLHPEDVPHLESLRPRAAIPGGTFELFGTHLLHTTNDGPQMPAVFFGDIPATLDLARPTRAVIRVPDGVISSDLTFRYKELTSNTLYANVGVPMAEELHMIANPCTDAEGNIYAMVSGPRGESVPVSIYRITRDLQIRPFVRDLLNVSALAIGPDQHLYASSRSEGTVYRISPEGAVSTFAEGMGIATGLAFDGNGNLFVGDRSGTIFKLGPHGTRTSAEIFVFCTLEPSVAAYHLAFRDDGTLLVTAPNTSSNQVIHAIDPDGNTTVFYRGLGRPQGMAVDADNNVYVAAALQGHRGIIRIDPDAKAELFIAGNDLVGLCFLEDGCAALATNTTLFHVDIGVTGRQLF